MIITPTASMKRLERMTAFLFTMGQVGLVLCLFWVFKTHLV